jgi:pimeloyl-ACP methyl ester carboxylesterase
MEDKFVQVGQVRTRYRALGDHGSTVILLHGIARSLEDWSENMQALSSVHRMIALDLVGFGLSDKPDVPYSVPFLAGFVCQFMQTLGLEKSIIMGNSMGGVVALELALTYPELVRALVLVAPAGIGPKGARWLGWCSVPILGELLAKPSKFGAQLIQKSLFVNQDFFTPERRARDYELAMQPRATKAFLKTLRSMANFKGLKASLYRSILERMASIQLPTLIVWGVQDHILPVEYAAVAQGKISNSELEIYDPCGHFPMLERADEFNARVLAYLKAQFP